MSDFKITCSIAKAYEKKDGNIIRRFIGGLASGTEIDLEGERMAESAISAFQKAISEGMTLPDGQWSMIPLRSGHRNEWDDQLGWIVGAEVDKEYNLWIEAELDQENPVAMSLYKKLTKKAEHGKPLKLGLSVGGTVVDAGYELNEQTQEFTKTYYDVNLREVSVVSQPAYPTSYLYALNKSVDWDKLKSSKDEAMVKAQTDEGTEAIDHPLTKETTMEDTTPINEEIEVQEPVVKDAVEEFDATEDVEKSGMDSALNDGSGMESAADSEASLSIGDLAQRVNALAATVDNLAAQLITSAEKSEKPAEEETVVKAVDATDPSELIKSAVLAALGPVMERLDRIENEPVDKSYAVLKSKYEDESFEVRMQREIEAVDGRDAVKRALELAFNPKA